MTGDRHGYNPDRTAGIHLTLRFSHFQVRAVQAELCAPATAWQVLTLHSGFPTSVRGKGELGQGRLTDGTDIGLLALLSLALRARDILAGLNRRAMALGAGIGLKRIDQLASVPQHFLALLHLLKNSGGKVRGTLGSP